jgi:transposase
MRGTDEKIGSLFSYVDLEERIPARHPLRKIRQVVNDALSRRDGEFEALYVDFGRPSIASERLIRASLIQILFLVLSERQLMKPLHYNLMFRWFVGLGIDDPVWVPTVFTKNCDRLLTTEMSRKVMAAILAHREVAPLLSDDHFSVDGTLVKAWATMKSFQPKADPTPPDEGGLGLYPLPTAPTKRQPKSRPTRCPAPTAMPRSTSRVRNARMPPMPRQLTRKRGSTRNRPAPARCAVFLGSCAHGEPVGSDRLRRSDPGRWPCRAAFGAGYGASPFPRIDAAAATWNGQGI